ncbi:MAG TPA: oxygenase MpaB family protein [Alphaproteobacteria bacterium]|jgi:uncharacterized protein (DUF2236 family)|nr:oxygenase MpaB family protein [Alphaproteobacteria bacterium]
MPPKTAPSLPAMIADTLTRPLRLAIANEVVGIFNDRSRGEKPVVRSKDGLLGPDSVAWRVHGDVTTMMVGGIAALLLQMLHPGVLSGVWDHSNFRGDMLGRLRRTARFISTTTYAGRTDAEAAIARVRAIHERIRGVRPDGTPYSATDPRLLAWVHATETVSFLDAWIQYGEPRMSLADQDRYFAEMAGTARALGADPVPTSRAEMMAFIARMRRELSTDDRSREVAALILGRHPDNRATDPLQAIGFQAAIDLLPPWARRMHGLHASSLGRPLVRAGTFGIARTLRWAFG